MRYRAPAWQTLVLTAVAATLVSGLLAFSRPIEMRVDGETLASDVSPVSTAPDRIYIPIRPIASALGATVTESKDGTIAVARGDQSLRLKVGDTHATFNGMPLTLKHAPFRVRGRVMIGMKAFGRAFGVTVSYDKHTARVDIQTGPTTAQTIDATTE